MNPTKRKLNAAWTIVDSKQLTSNHFGPPCIKSWLISLKCLCCTCTMKSYTVQTPMTDLIMQSANDLQLEMDRQMIQDLINPKP